VGVRIGGRGALVEGSGGAAVWGGGDVGGEVVGEEGVGGPANSVGVVIVSGVGEGTPLGGLVDGVGFEDEAAFRADGVAGGVVEHHLCQLLAIPTHGIRHYIDPSYDQLIQLL